MEDVNKELSQEDNLQFRWSFTHPFEQEINPKSDFVDVTMVYNGKIYTGIVTTLKYIKERMEYYRATGENVSGTYFCSKNLIIVEKITEKKVKKTLVDLLKRGDFNNFLSSN